MTSAPQPVTPFPLPAAAGLVGYPESERWCWCVLFQASVEAWSDGPYVYVPFGAPSHMAGCGLPSERSASGDLRWDRWLAYVPEPSARPFDSWDLVVRMSADQEIWVSFSL